jgi:hypothetical protein
MSSHIGLVPICWMLAGLTNDDRDIKSVEGLGAIPSWVGIRLNKTARFNNLQILVVRYV